jgi:hypothetical protein
MAKGDELIKYITERFVTYIETPKEVRREQRVNRRPKEPWKYRWFGMLPLSIEIWLDKKRKKRTPPPD